MANASTAPTFSCLNDSIVSSTNVTNPSFWMLRPQLLKGSPAVAVVIGVFFVVAFCWNLFILASFLIKHHLLKEPGNIFLFNLALVDFLVTVSNMLFSVVSESAREFVFGSEDVTRCKLCDTFGFLLIFLIAVSLHTLAALSVDRFILLAWPLKYKSIVNKRGAIIMLCLIWLIGFLIALPPLLRFGQYEFNTNFGACIPRFVDDPLLSPYNFNYVLLLVIEALIPLLILAVTNIWTYKIVSKVLKRNFRRRRTFHEGVTVEVKRESLRHQHQQQQLVKVFAALFIAHLISWTPVIVVVFIVVGINASRIPPQIYIFGWICYLTNPVLHPIIETFFVKDLRYQVRRVKSTMADTLLRAGSTLYRKASHYAFTLDALEEANKKLDQAEARKMKSSGNHSTTNLTIGDTSISSDAGAAAAPVVNSHSSDPAGAVVTPGGEQQDASGVALVVHSSNQIATESETLSPSKCNGCSEGGASDSAISEVVGKQ